MPECQFVLAATVPLRIDPVDAFADLFAANAEYASGFALGHLAAPPRRHVAVVTCMDARIDPLAILGLTPGDAHVLRNAGARVTDDVLRSLVKSVNQLEVTRVAVMHHTDCGAAKIKLPALREKVIEATGNDPDGVDFHLIGDEDEALRADVEAVAALPLPPGRHRGRGPALRRHHGRGHAQALRRRRLSRPGSDARGGARGAPPGRRPVQTSRKRVTATPAPMVPTRAPTTPSRA